MAVPTETPGVNFNDRAHALGPFGAQAPEPVVVSDVKAIIKAGRAFLRESNESLERWAQLGQEVDKWTPAPAPLRKGAERLTKNINEAVRSVSVSLYLQRAAWRIAQEVWPDVRKIHDTLLSYFRAGCRTLKSLNTKIDGASSELTQEVESTLKELRPELAARCWVCRSIVEQLRLIEKASTSWANRAEDGWNDNIPGLNPSRAISVALVLHKWQEDVASICRTLMVERRKTWMAEGYAKYEKEPDIVWFQFGSPSKGTFCTDALSKSPSRLLLFSARRLCDDISLR